MRTGRGEKIGVPGKNVFQKLKGKMISPEPRAAERPWAGGGRVLPPCPGEDPTGTIFNVSGAGSGQVSPNYWTMSIGDKGVPT